MVTQAKFYGGASERDSITDPAPYQLAAGSARVQVLVDANAQTRYKLPDARTLPIGGPHFYFINASAPAPQAGLQVRTINGTLLATLNAPAQEVAIVCLIDNTTEDGTWAVTEAVFGQARAYGSALPPAALILYCMGGGNTTPGGGGPIYDDVDTFLPSSGAWSTRNTFPLPVRQLEASTVIGGDIFLAGGTGELSAVYRLHEKYTKATDSYASVLRLLNPRRFGSAGAEDSGKSYIFGGRLIDKVEDTDEYTPATDVWAEKTPHPLGPIHLVRAESEGGEIYVFQGLEEDDTVSAKTYRYTPGSDSWAARTDRANSVYWQGSFPFVGLAHLVEGSWGATLHDAYSYAGDSYAAKTAKPGSRTTGPFSGSDGSGTGWSVAGLNAALNTVAEAYEYDRVGDSWTTETDLPLPLRHEGGEGSL
jgi:hypothetical protein